MTLFGETQRLHGWAGQEGMGPLPAGNHSIALILRGVLVTEALVDSLRELSNRHHWLRTNSPAGVLVQFADLTDLDSEERSRYEQRCQSRDLETPFDGQDGPFLRATLLKLAADVHGLTLTTQDSICNAASLGALVKDLGLGYTSKVRQETPDPSSKIALSDPGVSASPVGKLKTAPPGVHRRTAAEGGSTTSLLPTDRPRERTGRSMASLQSSISAGLCAKAARFAVDCDADQMSAYLTAFVILLGRFSGEPEVAVGLDRCELVAATVPELIGSSGELSPFSIGIARADTGEKLVCAVRRQIDLALPDQTVPAGSGIGQGEAAIGRPSVAFRFGALLDRELVDFAGLSVQLQPVGRDPSGCEVVLSLMQGPRGIEAEWRYDQKLFDAETIQGWAGCYQTLLRSLADEGSSPVSVLELITDEQMLALSAWNATPDPGEGNALLHGLVTRQALRVPDRIALRAGTARLSYRDLDSRANRLSRELQVRGASRGSRVGVLLDPGVDLVVAQLAVLKTQAACVPLDCGLAPDTLRELMELACLDLLVSCSSATGQEDFSNIPVLLLDEEAREVSDHKDTPLQAHSGEPAGEEPAFVICTGESAGKPRLAVLPHRALVNCIQDLASRPGLNEHDKLLAFADDGSRCFSLELFAALGVGAQVSMAHAGAREDRHLLKTLLESGVATAMQAGTSTWRGLLEVGWKGQPAFKAMVPAVDLDRMLATELLERQVELWCFYGVGEATGWATSARIHDPDLLPRPGPRKLPRRLMGRPAANSTVWVVDEQGEACPVGVPGELHIGGRCLALNYLNRRPLTAECFVPDRLGAELGGKVFRTGVRGRWRHDGVVEYLGPLRPHALQIEQGGHSQQDGKADRSRPAVNLAPAPRVRNLTPQRVIPLERDRVVERAPDAPAESDNGRSRQEAVEWAIYAVAAEPVDAGLPADHRLNASQDGRRRDAWISDQAEEPTSGHESAWDPEEPFTVQRSRGIRTSMMVLAGVLLASGAAWTAWQQNVLSLRLPADSRSTIGSVAAPPVPETSVITSAPPAQEQDQVVRSADAVSGKQEATAAVRPEREPAPVPLPGGPRVKEASAPAAVKGVAPASAMGATAPKESTPVAVKESTPVAAKEAAPVTAKEAVPVAVKEAPPPALSKEALAPVAPRGEAALAPGKEPAPPVRDAVAPFPVKAAAAPIDAPARSQTVEASPRVQPAVPTPVSVKDPVMGTATNEAAPPVTARNPVARPPMETAASSAPSKEVVPPRLPEAAGPPPSRELPAPAPSQQAAAPAALKEVKPSNPGTEATAPDAAKEPPDPMLAKTSPASVMVEDVTPTAWVGAVPSASPAPAVPAALPTPATPATPAAPPVAAVPPAPPVAAVPAPRVQDPVAAPECRKELQALGLCRKAP